MHGSVDTNILLRLIIGDVPAQYALVRKMLSHDKTYVVDDVAVIELSFALKNHYKFDRPTVANAINDVLSSPQFISNKNLFFTVTRHFVQCPALSFEDCYLAAKSKQVSATPLWTFDKKLAHQLPDTRLVASN